MDDKFKNEHCGACKLDLAQHGRWPDVLEDSGCPNCHVIWPTRPDLENEFADGDVCG